MSVTFVDFIAGIHDQGDEIKELRANGVPPHTISALYNFDSLDTCIEGCSYFFADGKKVCALIALSKPLDLDIKHLPFSAQQEYNCLYSTPLWINLGRALLETITQYFSNAIAGEYGHALRDDLAMSAPRFSVMRLLEMFFLLQWVLDDVVGQRAGRYSNKLLSNIDYLQVQISNL